MTVRQIMWNASTKVITIQAKGDAYPAGSAKIGEFHHGPLGDSPSFEEDSIGPDMNHVIYHHVRDALYHVGHFDMQIVSITEDNVYVALAGIAITPGVVSLAPGATQQLAITKTPTGASNGTVTWVSGTPARATVSATGLVTAVSTGTSVITATSQDGGYTATRTITVTA